MFDSTGEALEDRVSGEVLVGPTWKMGFGREIRLESISVDREDPNEIAAEIPGHRLEKLAVSL